MNLVMKQIYLKNIYVFSKFLIKLKILWYKKMFFVLILSSVMKTTKQR